MNTIMSLLTMLIVPVTIIVLVLVIKRWANRRANKEPRQPVPSSATGRPIGGVSTVRPTARDQLPRPFADVESQVEALRRQVRDGLLTEGECKAQMRELMVEGTDGNWWMVGYETGEWYRHDGTDWVLSDPPLARGDE